MNKFAICGSFLKITFIVCTFLTFMEFLMYAIILSLAHKNNNTAVGLTIVYEFFLLIYMITFMMLFVLTTGNRRRKIVTTLALYLIAIEIVVVLCLNAIDISDQSSLCKPLGLEDFCNREFWVITVIIALLKISYLLIYFSMWATEKIYTLTDGGATLINNEEEHDVAEDQRNSRIRISALPFSYPEV